MIWILENTKRCQSVELQGFWHFFVLIVKGLVYVSLLIFLSKVIYLCYQNILSRILLWLFMLIIDWRVILRTDFLLVSWVIPKHSFSGLGWCVPPLQEGEVGLVSWVLFNQTLLGKWLERFRIKRDQLWRRVTSVKYGETLGRKVGQHR